MIEAVPELDARADALIEKIPETDDESLVDHSTDGPTFDVDTVSTVLVAVRFDESVTVT